MTRILDELDVWVIGAGAVGLNIAIHAAQLHPQSLTIVDPGKFKPENLLTQRITPDAIGRNKAEYAGDLCARISPRTRVRVFAGSAEELPLAALCSAGVVMLATDNMTAEVEVSQRCLHAGVPLLQASVGPEMLVAQIRFCSNQTGNGPCLACWFGAGEWQHINRETVFSCEGANYDAVRPLPAHRSATRSLSFLCSIAADLAMVQCLRNRTDLGAPVVDTLLEYCGHTHRTTISPLTRNERCPCEHRRWTPCGLPRRVTGYSPRELVEMALGHQGCMDGVSLTIDGLEYCESGICTRCGVRQPIERFVRSLRGVGQCIACGSPVDGLPFCTHRATPLAVLGEQLDQRLQGFVDGRAESVVVRGPHATALCRFSGSADRID